MIYIKQSYVSKRAALLLTPWEMIITTPVRSLLPPPWEDLPYQALPMNCIMPKVDGVRIHGSSRRYGTCIYLHAIVIIMIELLYSSHFRPAAALKQMVSLFCIDNTFLFRFINSHPVQTFMICLLCLDVLILFIELCEFYIHLCLQKKSCIKHLISFFYLCQSSYNIYIGHIVLETYFPLCAKVIPK